MGRTVFVKLDLVLEPEAVRQVVRRRDGCELEQYNKWKPVNIGWKPPAWNGAHVHLFEPSIR